MCRKVGGGQLAGWAPAGLWRAGDAGAVLPTGALQQRGRRGPPTSRCYLVLMYTVVLKTPLSFLHILNFCTVLNSIYCLGRMLCNDDDGPGLQ